jgi:hypothetical protein
MRAAQAPQVAPIGSPEAELVQRARNQETLVRRNAVASATATPACQTG